LPALTLLDLRFRHIFDRELNNHPAIPVIRHHFRERFNRELGHGASVVVGETWNMLRDWVCVLRGLTGPEAARLPLEEVAAAVSPTSAAEQTTGDAESRPTATGNNAGKPPEFDDAVRYAHMILNKDPSAGWEEIRDTCQKHVGLAKMPSGGELKGFAAHCRRRFQDLKLANPKKRLRRSAQ
jgi:hypothetical protein